MGVYAQTRAPFEFSVANGPRNHRAKQLNLGLVPFAETDPTRFITSPLTIEANGSIVYTVMKLDPAEPWTKDVREAWLVKLVLTCNSTLLY